VKRRAGPRLPSAWRESTCLRPPPGKAFRGTRHGSPDPRAPQKEQSRGRRQPMAMPRIRVRVCRPRSAWIGADRHFTDVECLRCQGALVWWFTRSLHWGQLSLDNLDWRPKGFNPSIPCSRRWVLPVSLVSCHVFLATAVVAKNLQPVPWGVSADFGEVQRRWTM